MLCHPSHAPPRCAKPSFTGEQVGQSGLHALVIFAADVRTRAQASTTYMFSSAEWLWACAAERMAARQAPQPDFTPGILPE